LPAGDRWRSLQWLGERTAQDPRFAVAMVEHVYYLLTGRKVLPPPKDLDDPLHAARLRAHREQRRAVEAIAGRFARLDGQFLLPLQETVASVDALFEEAERCERAGDLAAAERLYALASVADPSDPVIPFNLGNVLDALARPREAAIAYLKAIDRDPAFAEAWVNLAGLYEASARGREAEQCLRKAVEARTDYADALYNLASLLTRQGRYAEALRLWEHYMGLRPDGEDLEKARRGRTLCRLALDGGPAAAEVERDGGHIA
jgi:tetratricopeptide (TPR) repeat protein